MCMVVVKCLDLIHTACDPMLYIYYLLLISDLCKLMLSCLIIAKFAALHEMEWIIVNGRVFVSL